MKNVLLLTILLTINYQVSGMERKPAYKSSLLSSEQILESHQNRQDSQRRERKFETINSLLPQQILERHTRDSSTDHMVTNNLMSEKPSANLSQQGDEQELKRLAEQEHSFMHQLLYEDLDTVQKQDLRMQLSGIRTRQAELCLSDVQKNFTGQIYDKKEQRLSLRRVYFALDLALKPLSTEKDEELSEGNRLVKNYLQSRISSLTQKLETLAEEQRHSSKR